MKNTYKPVTGFLRFLMLFSPHLWVDFLSRIKENQERLMLITSEKMLSRP